MTTPDSAWAIGQKTKIVAEDETYGFDFTGLLKSGETITSIVSCAPVSVPDTGQPQVLAGNDGTLTLVGSAIPNAAPFNDDSQPPVAVAIGKGITGEFTGGTAPTKSQKEAGAQYTRYDFQIVFMTSTGAKRSGLCTFLVPA